MSRKDRTDDGTAETIAVTSLIELARAAEQNGPAWSQSSDDLNVNLVVLREGHSIAEHVNNEVDVLLIGVEGEGHVTIDGQPMVLSMSQLVIVAKGAARSIAPVSARFAYLTCHRRRAGLWPTTQG